MMFLFLQFIDFKARSKYKFLRLVSGSCVDCSQSPIFREIVEIQRVLPLIAVILIFKCTEGAGVGDQSSRGRGRNHPTP